MKYDHPIRRAVEALESRRLMHGDVDLTFNFQPEGRPVPAGTIADYGYTYGNRGNGYSYGWNADNRFNARDRDKTSDQMLDTLIQMQRSGQFKWELEIPNGKYEVTIVSGDSGYLDGEHQIDAEGVRVMYGVQTEKKRYLKATKEITVADGRLTISPESTGVNSKIIALGLKSVHTPEAIPVVSIGPRYVTATEGGQNGKIRVARAGDDLDAALDVNLEWSGSAGSKDIESRPGTVTIPAGSTYVDLPVVAIDDTLDEATETATVKVVAGEEYTVSANSTVSISVEGHETAPPPPPPATPAITIAATDDSATEGGDTAKLRLTRSGGSASAQLVVALDWSGSAGSSDVSRPASATFAAGATTLDLTITATDDTLDESDETATATIATGGAYTVGSPSSASITIHDNDEPATPGGFSNINWSGTSGPPISYSETTSVVVDNKLYAFGGFNGGFSPQSNVYRFDGTSWSTRANSPVAFTHVGDAEVDGKIWFAGGYLGNGRGGQIFGTTDVRIYNPASDTWANGPALPSARAAGNLVKVGRKLYFFGGETFNRTADSTTMWALDLDNQSAGWQTKASMPMARNHASTVNVNGKIFVLGGQTGYDNGLTAHNEIQIYDPAANSWSVSSKKLPGNRSHTVSATQYYQGRIIIVAGESAHNQPQNTVWSIDPSTLVTTALHSFPDSRFSVATGIVNGKLYAFGGYQGHIATSAYVGTFV